MLDCRWVGINGAGRLTELLLRGLQRRPPEGRWVLWGPESVRSLTWPGAEVVLAALDPRAGFGQRSWFEVPACDLAVFMHQQRPLRAIPSVTVVLDTIPLRTASGRLQREARRLFLRRVVAVSREVVTISRHSRDCIGRDLGVDAARIEVLVPPVDDDFVRRVGDRRRGPVPGPPVALYVGAFLPHKNLDRLVAAFPRTRFAAGGGKLSLVGGTPAQVDELVGRLTPEQAAVVEVQARCGQPELESRFASALFVVQPSLEEGFGLPVWEAIACGLPVCVSDGGSLPEITAGLAEPFPATSVEAMTSAIDATADRAASSPPPEPGVPPGAPSVDAFASRFQEVVWRNLG